MILWTGKNLFIKLKMPMPNNPCTAWNFSEIISGLCVAVERVFKRDFFHL